MWNNIQSSWAHPPAETPPSLRIGSEQSYRLVRSHCVADVLCWTSFHCSRRVVDHCDSNRMSFHSMAIVFGPTLLRPEEESGNMAVHMVFQNQIVELILSKFNEVFSPRWVVQPECCTQDCAGALLRVESVDLQCFLLQDSERSHSGYSSLRLQMDFLWN